MLSSSKKMTEGLAVEYSGVGIQESLRLNLRHENNYVRVKAKYCVLSKMDLLVLRGNKLSMSGTSRGHGNQSGMGGSKH